MDLSDADVLPKRCFKCEYSLLDNLNIIYNASNSMIVLWNKYQIFLYENLDFENTAKYILPEYQIHHLSVSDNQIVCLDRSGNIHIISLKFKNENQKCIKTGFLPREQNILQCTNFHYEKDSILSLKWDAGDYYLCLNKNDSNFKFMNRVILINNHEQIKHKKQEQCLLKTHVVTENDNDCVKQIFNIKDDIHKQQSIIILSFDKITVYACLFNAKMTDEQTMLVKIYTCPSEICDIEIIDLQSIIIGLTIGTLIKFSLKDVTKTEIVHLNKTIHTFIAVKDFIYYTDGLSLWQAENPFTENIKFNQLSIKHAKSLMKSGDQIIVTTFTKLIYVWPIDDKSCYVKPESAEEYSSAETVLNNSQYLNKIMVEIEKNNALVKKVNAEENYIAALALSKRQDIMDTVIKNNVTIYDSYEDAINENANLTLTEELAAYLDPESYLCLINVTASAVQRTLSNVLSNLLGNLRIHIILSHKKVLKTTSITLKEPLKKINLLIPLKTKCHEVNVSIKLLMKMPGALDEKKNIWTILYRKNLVVNAEHFIKMNDSETKTVNLIKSKESMEDLIEKSAVDFHGNIFQFTDPTNLIENYYSVYVKLPENYKDVNNGEYCKKYLNMKKTTFLLQQLNMEKFLQSKSKLTLAVHKEKVHVEIINDGISNPVLKLTSHNIKLVTNLRNFFANMFYNDFVGCEPEKDFINHKFYASVENFQKLVRNCMLLSSDNETRTLMEQFERDIIGALPL